MKYFFRYFFRTLRIILGPFMLLWEWISTPHSIERSAQEQQDADDRTRKLVLYQFKTCPFCIKTRRAIRRLSLNIELRDTQKNETYRQELANGGGQVKVPCLRIEKDDGDYSWLYESDDIIQYLEENYSPKTPN